MQMMNRNRMFPSSMAPRTFVVKNKIGSIDEEREEMIDDDVADSMETMLENAIEIEREVIGEIVEEMKSDSINFETDDNAG